MPAADHSLRIGIDIGGTNTDAVLLDGSKVLAARKVPTTLNLRDGIVNALAALDSEIDNRPVDAMVLGTTHFMNALVEAKKLSKVACIRLATPPQTLMPFVDWPEKLRSTVEGLSYIVSGGHQFTGQAMAPLDRDGLARAAESINQADIHHLVVSAVFSPVTDEAETEAASVLGQHLESGTSITLSHEIGQLGLLERENAAILNAALLDEAAVVVDGLLRISEGAGQGATLYVTQNDGTLMDVATARLRPIYTVSSGPTNSMRGAALLSGERDAVVVDVGGTTSDIGLLRQGFPRESPVAVEVSGVRTNFRMPDVASLGIGGGSLISPDGQVGPRSVGHRLKTEALVFGGETTTLTDIGVAAGMIDVGDPALVSHLPRQLVHQAIDSAQRRIVDADTAAQLSADPPPTIVVGGGAFVLHDAAKIAQLIVPEHGQTANAVGAALAQVSGNVDSIFSLDGTTREAMLDHARTLASERAVAAGARDGTVRIVDEDEVPLTHLPGGTATRIRVKAVGDLATTEGTP